MHMLWQTTHLKNWFILQLLVSDNVRSYASVKSDEAEKAKTTAATLKDTIGQPTIFSKIIDKSIPADIVYEDDLVVFTFPSKLFDMKIYSEHCTQNIVNNNQTQYKQVDFTTILQATMFERGKFEVNDFCINLPLTYLNNGYKFIFKM